MTYISKADKRIRQIMSIDHDLTLAVVVSALLAVLMALPE
jgi:hypothetical protein